MATNKAKRSIHLAQPQRRSSNTEQILRSKYGLRISPAGSQPLQTRLHARKTAQPAAGLMPVKAHIYRAIAEWNGGLEEAMQSLKKLQQVNFLPSSHLAAMYHTVSGLRAQATRNLLAIRTQPETA